MAALPLFMIGWPHEVKFDAHQSTVVNSFCPQPHNVAVVRRMGDLRDGLSQVLNAWSPYRAELVNAMCEALRNARNLAPEICDSVALVAGALALPACCSSAA